MGSSEVALTCFFNSVQLLERFTVVDQGSHTRWQGGDSALSSFLQLHRRGVLAWGTLRNIRTQQMRNLKYC